MNPPCLLVVALLGATTLRGSAFTLDAAGYDGGELARYPLTVRVPGYGEMILEENLGALLVVNPGYANGAAAGSGTLTFDLVKTVSISVIEVTDDGHGMFAASEGRGRDATVWNAIPEPASAGLGIVGVLALLLGRRR